jgi:molybdenum cofactor synthesis domain-containing protein
VRVECRDLGFEARSFRSAVGCTRDLLREAVFFRAKPLGIGESGSPFDVQVQDAGDERGVAFPRRRAADALGVATDKSDIEQNRPVMRASGALLPGQTFEPAALLAPAQAILAYQARVKLAPLGVERVPLDGAFGRILAQDAVADGRYPSHPRSTMDGFAVRSADTLEERRITGEIRMGHAPPAPLGTGEAMRIPTGGAVPDGADAVVPIEDTDDRGDRMTPREMPTPGDAITPPGEDMEPGDLILAAGTRIDGAAMGVLATLGFSEVPVWRRPLVAIISTGDELVDPSGKPGIGQVRDSNRYALAGALRDLGVEPVHLPRVEDTPEALERAMREALATADAVMLTGGSSVGVRDLVPRTIERLGEPGVIVHGLRVRPGKPTVLGAIGSKPIIGLPGNPTSALMIFLNIAAPVLRGLTGEVLRPRAPSIARAKTKFQGRAGWTWFVPARVEAQGSDRVVSSLGIHSSHTSLLARANSFVVLSEDRPNIAAGEQIEVHALSGGET